MTNFLELDVLISYWQVKLSEHVRAKMIIFDGLLSFDERAIFWGFYFFELDFVIFYGRGCVILYELGCEKFYEQDSWKHVEWGFFVEVIWKCDVCVRETEICDVVAEVNDFDNCRTKKRVV